MKKAKGFKFVRILFIFAFLLGTNTSHSQSWVGWANSFCWSEMYFYVDGSQEKVYYDIMADPDGNTAYYFMGCNFSNYPGYGNCTIQVKQVCYLSGGREEYVYNLFVSSSSSWVTTTLVYYNWIPD